MKYGAVRKFFRHDKIFIFTFPLRHFHELHWMSTKRQLNQLGHSFALPFRGSLYPSFLKEGWQPRQLLTPQVL